MVLRWRVDRDRSPLQGSALVGRFGDWSKGPWKDTVRVEVSYEIIESDGKKQRFQIITVIPKLSLNPNRDAAERVKFNLSKTVKPPKHFQVLSTTVEGETPFIHPAISW